MKIFRTFFPLALSALLTLGLTACGGGDSKETAGDDWRDGGDVVGRGAITRDGGSTDVLVTVDDTGASFYLDRPEQLLFAVVSFPEEIPDAQESFQGASFDDVDGDGQSDVSLGFADDSGGSTSLVWVWDSNQRYVFREDLSVLTTNSVSVSDYVGLWRYGDINLWLRIHDDGAWELLNEQEEVAQSGSLQVDEEGVTLCYSDTGDAFLRLDRAESGELLDNENGGTFTPVDSIEPNVPYFTENGLAFNAAADGNTYLLKNGVCSFVNQGDRYGTGDCYWSVVKNSDTTQDGIREIQFNAVCYVPSTSVGAFTTRFFTGIVRGLYDFYSGKGFTESDAYGGNGHYVHTVEWNGQSGQIEFSWAEDNQFFVGDWYKILTLSYVVSMPEWYDGLVFAAVPVPGSYADFTGMSNVPPETLILDEPLDVHSCLLFNVCG